MRGEASAGASPDMAPLAPGEVVNCPNDLGFIFVFLTQAQNQPSFWLFLLTLLVLSDPPPQVIRINTGAPVPPGADAVVMVEETRLVEATEDGEEVKVEILTKVTLVKLVVVVVIILMEILMEMIRRWR